MTKMTIMTKANPDKNKSKVVVGFTCFLAGRLCSLAGLNWIRWLIDGLPPGGF